ncbi:MAG: hypothetical protein CMK89_04120 [Pseudomonadales bacterium]|nr:hypothetical protein [Pseudomonadales bacterium]RLU02108.1 MAG: hypothetical protein D9N11_10895 [Ketobacter sp.]
MTALSIVLWFFKAQLIKCANDLIKCAYAFVLERRPRQNLAQRYSRDPNMQITRLSDLLGYRDLSVFSRAFTQRFGVLPRNGVRINRAVSR